MRVTVDANILFACLIKDSATRRLVLNPTLTLFTPEFLKDELATHIIEIKEKSGMNDEELLLMIQKVFAQVTFVPDKDLKPFLNAAANLIADPKDWLYIACALHEDTVIWSNDNDFGSQKRIRILKTKELVSIVGSL
jgi:predicted nucleic acid-binding protein